MHSKKVATIAILVSLAIATNYAMMPIYNVKLMDIIVFLGGFCFGPLAGALIGVTSWAVYGTLNPLGFSVPILLATMFSESIYGVAGGLVKKSFIGALGEFKKERTSTCVFFGTLGFLLTLIYDAITNVVFGYLYSPSIIVAVIIGFVPFGLVHVISNAFFFGFGCVPAIKALLNFVGVKNLDISEK